MKVKWLVFMFGAKTFIGTLAGKKLSVHKMGNKTPSGVMGYIIVVDVKCYFCLGLEISVHPSPLSFSDDVSQPEANCSSNCRRLRLIQCKNKDFQKSLLTLHRVKWKL